MNEVVSKRIRRSPDQWQQLIDNQLASGLSAMAFCKEQNIGYASFCQWRNRLMNGSDAKVGTDNVDRDFIDLSGLNRSGPNAGAWQIVLKLGDGVELQLTRDRD